MHMQRREPCSIVPSVNVVKHSTAYHQNQLAGRITAVRRTVNAYGTGSNPVLPAICV
jgi:hypothetical protein